MAIEVKKELLVKNLLDPYIYFLEPMDYQSMNQNDMRFLLGSSSAEEVLIMKIRYPIDKIWLKFERGRPTHIVTEGDVIPKYILERKGQTMEIRKIS